MNKCFIPSEDHPLRVSHSDVPRDAIVLRGVKTNNLQDITCSIPQRAITVLTGVSGSGKSSLAFDTLYAEGQRRFLESMSTYVRMFLSEMPKPPMDSIENCLPAIALRQQSSFEHPRSNVSSVSELWVYVAQLFANAANFSCPACGGVVESDNNKHIVERLEAYGRKLRIVLHAKLNFTEGLTPAEHLSQLVERGYQRLWKDGHILELADAQFEELLDSQSLDVLIDRLIITPDAETPPRLYEALEEGFLLGGGKMTIDILDPDARHSLVFDRQFSCRSCAQVYAPLRPEFFDPNSTLGACPTCTGFGSTTGIDWDKAINPNLSLRQNCVVPFATASKHARLTQLLAFCEREKIDLDVKYSLLDPKEQEMIKFGKGPFKGVMGFFEHLQAKGHKFTNRITLARYRGYVPCAACDETGFSPIARQVRLHGKSIVEVYKMDVDSARSYFEAMPDAIAQGAGSEIPLEEIRLRLRTLSGVGLGYLGLSRKTKTLSGGEAQRLHLSCGLGRGLCDTLYVLDEPTAGLHARDSVRLVGIIKELCALGNTVVVVEHDTEVIGHADYVIELGPEGGERGGQIIFEGDVKGLRESPTPTGQMLRSETRKTINDKAPTAIGYIEIRGAKRNNLKNVDLKIPLGQLVVIAGVSGSGKSTLIRDVLYEAWLKSTGLDADQDFEAESDDDSPKAVKKRKKNNVDKEVLKTVAGLEHFDEVIMMHQGSAGRSLRASVATMTKAFTNIRTLFSRLPESKASGFEPGHFSYNAARGRCPSCEGLGYKKIEMMFMSDVVVDCDACEGKRYLPEILRIRLRGLNIFDVLSLTVKQAVDFFQNEASIHSALQSLMDVGLGYVRLGQSTSTLSGGEFQRLRLATYLDKGRRANARTLLIFDEPTVGLHMQDVVQFIEAMHILVRMKASVIVIEHNLDFIAHAHHVIELGPDAGPKGGEIVFEGSPKDLFKDGHSLTSVAMNREFSGDAV